MYRGGFFAGHGGPHVLAILFLIAFVVAVLALVMFAVRWFRGAPRAPAAPAGAHPTAADPAVAAARMRYARGELSREDFLRIAEDLGEQLTATGPGA